MSRRINVITIGDIVESRTAVPAALGETGGQCLAFVWEGATVQGVSSYTAALPLHHMSPSSSSSTLAAVREDVI